MISVFKKPDGTSFWPIVVSLDGTSPHVTRVAGRTPPTYPQMIVIDDSEVFVTLGFIGLGGAISGFTCVFIVKPVSYVKFDIKGRLSGRNHSLNCQWRPSISCARASVHP